MHTYRAVGDPALPGGGGILLSDYGTDPTADSSGVFTFTLPPSLTRFNITLQTLWVAGGGGYAPDFSNGTSNRSIP